MIDMKVCNYLVGILCLVIGGAIMNASAGFSLEMTEAGPGPGVWPFALGIVLFAAALVLLGYTFLNRKMIAQRQVLVTMPANLRVYMVMLLAVVFCLLLETVGFYLAALLLIPAVMFVLGCKKPIRIALTAIITVCFIYVIFDVLLRSKLPQSMFLG